MGCGASVAPAPTISKVDVGTNTIDIDSSTETVKRLIETSTQTNNIEVKINERIPNQENQNEDLNYPTVIRTLDDPINRNESIESIDDHINPRFNQEVDDDKAEVVWVLHGLDASQFSLSAQYLITSASQVLPSMVVDAVEKTNDLSTISKSVWQLLYKARETNDATYLIRAYTAESNFYKILNRKLARQTLANPDGMTVEGQLQSMMGDVFHQLGQAMSMFQAFQAGQPIQTPNSTQTDWTKLYLQAIYRLIMIPNSTLRYQGRTYRGMRLKIEQLAQYEHKSYAANKAITSTSKLRDVAQNFIDCGPRPDDMIDVMFIYIIDTYSSLLAIDVHTFSLSPREQEVLIMPGILFSVGEIKVNASNSVEIEMRSAFQEMANGGFANSLTELFSSFSSDLD